MGFMDDAVAAQVRRSEELNVGDRCWFLDGSLVSFVDVKVKHRYLEGEKGEFCLYTLTKVIGGYEREYVHRSQLFKCPEQRDKLLDELRKDIRRLREYYDELSRRDEDYVPDPDKDDI